MNYNFIKRLIICFAIGFFTVSIIFAIGCAPKRVVVGYEEGGNHGYSEDGQKHKHKKKGPPAHAPAHGYRSKHHYRYYPSRSVYYDSDRRIYFYIEGDNWEVGASLPSSLRMGLGDSVSIELDTDKPYIYHEDHVKKYPPGQMKKKNKKKGKWG
jgi:hypothetical protein